MIFLSPLLLAISSNIDTLSVSSSYGTKKIYLPKSSMILLTILTSISLLISMYIGRLIQPLFGFKLDNIFGAVLLSFIGVSFIVEYIRLEQKHLGYDTSYFFVSPMRYKNILENPIIVDSDKSNHIDIKECFNLSLAIGTDNFLASFAASITGVNIGISVFFYFILSIIAVYFGYFNTNMSLIKWFQEHSYFISGTILIVLGIYEAFV
ncbi:manganese efflux pump [Clostridium sp.]|uniref:manganese efflux pump n=1 Tax=Clostridium sp. TaxID=1506 RepID=UPI00261804F8|nr:manganese efflux pump [Clostridium sp.]